jgi:flagellar biosynthetic protein FlhB
MAQPDRTEKPTPKKRREARKKGQVPRSKEVASAATFLTTLMFLMAGGTYLLSEFQSLFQFFWGSFLFDEISHVTAQELASVTLWGVIRMAGPVMGLTFLVALGASLAQGGLVLASEPLKFNSDKVNPAKNLKKVFSKRGWVELAKSLGLISVVIYLAASVVWNYLELFQSMIVMDIRMIVTTWGSTVSSIGIRVGIFLGIVAVGDYLFQRYSHEEGLKQTKHEVKEDMKDTEGQPLVKARIRRLQREMARRRMLSAVKTADVVITNPTHFAVALKYELQEMPAPLVVAKGQDYMAQKIKEIASEEKVPLFEDVELARTLYKTVEVGDAIPTDLYKAVAQILAYVYKMKEETYH